MTQSQHQHQNKQAHPSTTEGDGPSMHAAFSDEQLKMLKIAMKERSTKTGMEAYGVEILIVEDQLFSRNLLMSVLQYRQFVCHNAKDGKEALELYAEHAPDIVFMDVELPDINGHALAKLIRQTDPKSHVVMVTSNLYQRDVNLAKENGVQGFIAKPYTKQSILNAINGYIKRQEKNS